MFLPTLLLLWMLITANGEKTLCKQSVDLSQATIYTTMNDTEHVASYDFARLPNCSNITAADRNPVPFWTKEQMIQSLTLNKYHITAYLYNLTLYNKTWCDDGSIIGEWVCSMGSLVGGGISTLARAMRGNNTIVNTTQNFFVRQLEYTHRWLLATEQQHTGLQFETVQTKTTRFFESYMKFAPSMKPLFLALSQTPVRVPAFFGSHKISTRVASITEATEYNLRLVRALSNRVHHAVKNHGIHILHSMIHAAERAGDCAIRASRFYEELLHELSSYDSVSTSDIFERIRNADRSFRVYMKLSCGVHSYESNATLVKTDFWSAFGDPNRDIQFYTKDFATWLECITICWLLQPLGIDCCNQFGDNPGIPFLSTATPPFFQPALSNFTVLPITLQNIIIVLQTNCSAYDSVISYIQLLTYVATSALANPSDISETEVFCLMSVFQYAVIFLIATVVIVFTIALTFTILFAITKYLSRPRVDFRYRKTDDAHIESSYTKSSLESDCVERRKDTSARTKSQEMLAFPLEELFAELDTLLGYDIMYHEHFS